jgi:hypothetical protein
MKGNALIGTSEKCGVEGGRRRKLLIYNKLESRRQSRKCQWIKKLSVFPASLSTADGLLPEPVRAKLAGHPTNFFRPLSSDPSAVRRLDETDHRFDAIQANHRQPIAHFESENSHIS